MEKQGRLKFVECPRDAMQGMPAFVPTALKIEYLNQLLRVGFDTLDFGSFCRDDFWIYKGQSWIPRAHPHRTDCIGGVVARLLRRRYHDSRHHRLADF